MQVDYGPPGQRGVTTLMAVGADELGTETPTETAVRKGFWFALAAAGVGALAKSPTIVHGALGAALAMGAIRMCADRSSTVAVTAPAPAAAGWWY